MPEEPNPYAPTTTPPGDPDEVEMARRMREPERAWMFLGGMVLVIAGAVLSVAFVGFWGGLIVAFIGGSALWGLYRITTRTPRALSPAFTAGGTACPACGSMQTDQSWIRSPDGRGEVLAWNCFACSHQWRS